MINQIINIIASNLVSRNTWLSEIRSIGYLNVINGQKTITDTFKEIGITDTSGNSGYIRFQNDINFVVRNLLNQMTGCRHLKEITYAMELVLAVKTAVPESVALLIAMQLDEIPFGSEFDGYNVKVAAKQGGSNSVQIVQRESGGNQWNDEYRAMFVDFTIQFTWDKNCDQIPIDMACETCENPLDLGCKQHCEIVGIGTDATYTGEMTLKTIFNGVQVTQIFEVTEGEEISIPLENLNENYEFNIQLFDAEGEAVLIGLPSEDYDCVKIKVIP